MAGLERDVRIVVDRAWDLGAMFTVDIAARSRDENEERKRELSRGEWDAG